MRRSGMGTSYSRVSSEELEIARPQTGTAAKIYLVFRTPQPNQLPLTRYLFGTPPLEHVDIYVPGTDSVLTSVQSMQCVHIANVSALAMYSTTNTANGSDWIAVGLNSLTDEEVIRFYKCAWSYVGRPYNYGGLVSQVLHRFNMQFRYPARGVFCSEYIASVLADAGLINNPDTPERPQGIDPAYVKPSDLYHIAIKL